MTEDRELRRRGMKRHPASGAGSIKHDGSDADTLVEVKDSRSSFTLKRQDIETLYKRAVRQGKDAMMVVVFPGYTAEITVYRS